MARTVKEARLDSRAARRALAIQKEPYWRVISSGAHVGYRRTKGSSGSWFARMRNENKKYVSERMGSADDVEDADGIRVLNFSQAQEKCREWFQKITHEQAGLNFGPYTVNMAIQDYMRWFKNNRKSYDKTNFMIEAFIRPDFGNMNVERLSSEKIRTWLENLSTTAPRMRVKKGTPQKYHRLEKSEDGIRKRRASANRYLNILKAILNKAFQDGKVPSDIAWRRVKPFKNVNSPRIEYFELDELKRLINACPLDLRNLVYGAVYTGCRYAELGRMVVSDFNAEIGQVHVRTSKNGRARFVILTDEAQSLFLSLCLDKKQTDLIFVRANGSTWGTSYQQRPFQEALKNARIIKDVNFHSLRHTHASQLAMAGVEMLVIAKQLGHSDTRMVERHYAHLAPSYISDRIRKSLPSISIEANNIVRISNK